MGTCSKVGPPQPQPPPPPAVVGLQLGGGRVGYQDGVQGRGGGSPEPEGDPPDPPARVSNHGWHGWWSGGKVGGCAPSSVNPPAREGQRQGGGLPAVHGGPRGGPPAAAEHVWGCVQRGVRPSPDQTRCLCHFHCFFEIMDVSVILWASSHALEGEGCCFVFFIHVFEYFFFQIFQR